MKIAISSDGNTVESKIDQRFGRCKYFVIVDTDDISKIETIENPGAIEAHGAGIKAAQQLGESNVKAVITGQLGPNAIAVLDQLGIKAYHASGIVKTAISNFVEGKLDEISKTADPHPEILHKQKSGERIFFPLLDNNGENSKISPHFGHAPFFGIYDVEKKELKIIDNNLDHTDPAKSPIDQIEEAVDPTTFFAKGIGGRAIQLIAEKGMTLKTGPFDTVKEVIENWDKLEDQTQSCGHEYR